MSCPPCHISVSVDQYKVATCPRWLQHDFVKALVDFGFGRARSTTLLVFRQEINGGGHDGGRRWRNAMRVAQRELSPSVDDNVVVEEMKWEFTQRELSPGVDNVVVVREMKWEFTSASYRQVTTTTIKQRQARTDQWLRSDRIPNQRSRFDFRFQGVSVSSSHWSTTLLVFRWEINGGGRRRRNAMSIPRRELFPSADNDDDKSKTASTKQQSRSLAKMDLTAAESRYLYSSNFDNFAAEEMIARTFKE